MVSTLAPTPRIASLTASFSVALPDSHRHDLGAEQLHAPHVERLALDVDRAHVDGAAEPEQRGAGGRGDAVLARAGLRDHALLAHAPREQAWPSTLLILCEPVCVRSSRLSSTRTPSRSESRWHSVTGVGPAGVAREQRRVLGAERVVGPRVAELGLELRRARGRASRARSGRRTRRSARARPARARAARDARRVPRSGTDIGSRLVGRRIAAGCTGTSRICHARLEPRIDRAVRGGSVVELPVERPGLARRRRRRTVRSLDRRPSRSIGESPISPRPRAPPR